jgi:haloalkane dehalogenase
VLREKPALILWGERDRAFTARDLARWQEILPQACTHRFPRAGHFVQEEDPEGFVRRLEEFLISLESPAAGAPR